MRSSGIELIFTVKLTVIERPASMVPRSIPVIGLELLSRIPLTTTEPGLKLTFSSKTSYNTLFVVSTLPGFETTKS